MTLIAGPNRGRPCRGFSLPICVHITSCSWASGTFLVFYCATLIVAQSLGFGWWMTLGWGLGVFTSCQSFSTISIVFNCLGQSLPIFGGFWWSLPILANLCWSSPIFADLCPCSKIFCQSSAIIEIAGHFWKFTEIFGIAWKLLKINGNYWRNELKPLEVDLSYWKWIWGSVILLKGPPAPC